MNMNMNMTHMAISPRTDRLLLICDFFMYERQVALDLQSKSHIVAIVSRNSSPGSDWCISIAILRNKFRGRKR